MKKRIISVLVCAVLLSGLLVSYFLLVNREEPEEDSILSEETTEDTSIVSRAKDDVVSAVFENSAGTLTFVSKEKTDEDDTQNWTLVGYEDVVLNNSTVDSMVRGAYNLLYSEKVMDEVEQPEQYGFQPAQATATVTYTDGTTTAVYIGNQTPDKNSYYVMAEGSSALYMIYSSTGQRFLNDLNAIVDKTIPTVDTEALQYVYINERDGKEIEADYYGSASEKKEQMEQYGMVSLTMFKPYPGRDIYLTNLVNQILSDVSSIKLSDLVEINPSDLAAYGLDDPALEIRLIDTSDNDLHLFIGNDTDDDMVYCKTADSATVYTMKKSAVEKFYNVDVFKFIDRFVDLENIEYVSEVNVAGEGSNYHIFTNKEVIPPETEDGRETVVYKPTVDGQEVQEKAFKTYYQFLIGLSYDTELSDYEPAGHPVITISYIHNNDTPDTVTEYYDYNENFYAVQADDGSTWYAVSKQNMKLMFQSMDNLLAGKLDES